MSTYSQSPLDFTGLKTISLKDRGGKVTTGHFAKPYRPGDDFLASLPKLLAADSLRAVVAALQHAKQAGRAIIWGLGGHVIKCGLAPILIDLKERGYATAFAMNGSAAIHDFEIALAGYTSEDVEAVLPDGRFGSTEETGREMNDVAREALDWQVGIGEAYGRKLQEIADPRFASQSLLLNAYKSSTPVTVHIAIGTDTPHTHPNASGAAIGAGTHHDFRLFCSLVTALNDGGLYLNVGSAVILPEVFLKAVSVVRNLGHQLGNCTTVNFDFLQHYRPRANVVERPHAQTGGQGYSITGHHEINIPLLAALLAEADRV